MMNNRKILILCLVIPLAAGGLAALLSGGGMDAFENLNKPPLSPPGILFPIVWTILYLLMGLASYFVIASDSGKEETKSAVTLSTAVFIMPDPILVIQLCIEFMMLFQSIFKRIPSKKR